MSVTDPLRAEHAELRPHLDALDTLAAELGNWGPEAAERVTAAVAFLQHHLLPHAAAEEAALYPVVEQALGAPGATATMAADHREITRRVHALDAFARTIDRTRPTTEHLESLQAQLYGLSAILHLHLAKEEEVLLPVLDAHLDEEQSREMFAAMSRVAHPDASQPR